jgi:hypothetical protein
MISDDPGAPTRGRCRTPSLDSAPMSADRHLHDPPRPRTEVDVAGAAIVAILDARIVPFTPGMIGRLSRQPAHRWQRSKKAWELKVPGAWCCAPNPPANCRRADCGSDGSNSSRAPIRAELHRQYASRERSKPCNEGASTRASASVHGVGSSRRSNRSRSRTRALAPVDQCARIANGSISKVDT